MPTPRRGLPAGHAPRVRPGPGLKLGLALVFSALVAGVVWLALADPPAPRRDGYRVVASFPHDPAAFTQGLVYVDGELFEGTGGYGQSSLRRVDLATGRVLTRVDLAAHLFGEGVAAWGSELIQLTWKNGLGLRYGRADLAPGGRFALIGEGWGLTQDGRWWIVSDGSATLRFLDPTDGREVRRVTVTDQGRPVTQLNELEYIDGEVWANLWFRDELVRIDPRSGRVLGYVDLSGLWPERPAAHREAVLNGIAWDAADRRLFVTGKLWPRLYQIEVVPAAR